MKFYDIAISRSFLPARKLKATDHFWSDDEKRLTVVTSSEESFCFGNMDKRTIRLGANYRTYKESMKPTIVRPTLAEQERAYNHFQNQKEHMEAHMNFIRDEMMPDLPEVHEELQA